MAIKTKEQAERRGFEIGHAMLRCEQYAGFSLEDWQKLYREYGSDQNTRGMANWRKAAQIRGTRSVIYGHIKKLMDERPIRYDVYVWLPSQNSYVVERRDLTNAQAEALVRDLSERKWQTDIRLVGV
jgi:hypothetical protein